MSTSRCSVSLQTAAQENAPKTDRFAPLRFLVGTWRGDQAGKPGQGTVDRTYQFILNDNEFRERFELAEPGRAFELYSEAHLKRVRERLCDPDHKPPPRVKPVGAS
jgi:hypothetical protein